MTQNQVNYWNMVENRRHNQATEEVQQTNAATERTKVAQDFFVNLLNYSSQDPLRKAQTEQAKAQVNLISAQTNTESAKQDLTKAQAEYNRANTQLTTEKSRAQALSNYDTYAQMSWKETAYGDLPKAYWYIYQNEPIRTAVSKGNIMAGVLSGLYAASDTLYAGSPGAGNVSGSTKFSTLNGQSLSNFLKGWDSNEESKVKQQTKTKEQKISEIRQKARER